MIGDLQGITWRERAKTGPFTTLEEPPSELLLKAPNSSFCTSRIDGRAETRTSILTSGDLIDGHKEPMASLQISRHYRRAEPIATNKAAERQAMLGT